MGELRRDDNLFSGLVDSLSKISNYQEGDYKDNEGFLVCGKCHTRKQYDADLTMLFGEVRRVPIMCKCEQEARKAEEEARKMQELSLRIERLKQAGISDPKYLRWTFEADDRTNGKMSAAARRYVEKWPEMREKNMGLLFYGDVGTGKSFMAACIANAIINKGIPVIMTNISALITAMSKDFEADKAQILDRISEVPLLVLDDVGVERGTEFVYEKVQEIVDTRYRSGKPLIVTTNLSPQELANPADMRYKRVFDRLLEMCFPVKFEGKSRRMGKAYQKSKDAKELLGL